MENGLYEKILDSRSKKELENINYKQIRNVDSSEVSNVLSITYQKMIHEILLYKDDNAEKLQFIEALNKAIGIEGFEYDDKKFKELVAVHSEENSFDLLNQFRPKTSIATRDRKSVV